MWIFFIDVCTRTLSLPKIGVEAFRVTQIHTAISLRITSKCRHAVVKLSSDIEYELNDV